MKCRICDSNHKNTSRYQLWLEHKMCRACYYMIEIFSRNGNYLKEYWEDDILRCKLCNVPHNTSRHQSWLEYQVCRTCSFVLDVFTLDSNYLKEYWEISHAQ